MNWLAPPFRHLLRLTTRVGLLEHADGVVPRHEHGYCTDDVARGLVAVWREPSPGDELVAVARRYLYFLTQAQAPDGRFRNRLRYDRRWRDEPGTGDCWGRALWGLGTAVARGPPRRSARSRLPHAMAFAALGAAEVLGVLPGHPAALSLLAGAVGVIGEPPAGAAWPLPLPRLSYANAAIAGAVIVGRVETWPWSGSPQRPADAGMAAGG